MIKIKPSLIFITTILLVFITNSVSFGNTEAKITGEAFYRERIAVPPETQLEVVLEDVSLADAPSEVIGKTIMENVGQPPYTFEIPYQPDKIKPSHSYSVRARLTHQDQLLFTTDQVYPVITRGNPQQVQLLLKQVARSPNANHPITEPATFTGDLPCADCAGITYHLDLFPDRAFFLRRTYQGKSNSFDEIGRWELTSEGKVLVLQNDTPLRFSVDSADALSLLDQQGNPIESELNYTLRKTSEFSPIAPRLQLRGMYSYLADAGQFTECRTGKTMPVAMEADNRALERAYLEARSQPAQALLVTVKGQIAQRMPMEGPSPVLTLIPEKFMSISPQETCDRQMENRTLQNTYWKVIQIGNNPVRPLLDRQQPHIFLEKSNQLVGFDGCNRFSGNYQVEGNNLNFTPTASTLLPCGEGAAQALEFHLSLDRVDQYHVTGTQLEFFDETGEVLARFSAIEFP